MTDAHETLQEIVDIASNGSCDLRPIIEGEVLTKDGWLMRRSDPKKYRRATIRDAQATAETTEKKFQKIMELAEGLLFSKAMLTERSKTGERS